MYADNPPVHQKRILVIDDNHDGADSLAMLLRIWGFSTNVAYSARQALELARASRPDCVLSDIGLPDRSGYEIAAEFRRDESLRTIPLIAITALPDAEKSRRAGFAEHLVKPAEPAAIKALLEKWLAEAAPC